MVIKRLTNLCLLRGRLFNLRLWFWEVFLSFLWWLLCCVMVDIPIFSSFFFSPIFILFFSIHFGVFIFFRLVRSLWKMKKDKKFLIVLQGYQKRESPHTRGYLLLEQHVLRDVFITLVWQTVKTVDFNILGAKGLIP